MQRGPPRLPSASAGGDAPHREPLGHPAEPPLLRLLLTLAGLLPRLAEATLSERIGGGRKNCNRGYNFRNRPKQRRWETRACFQPMCLATRSCVLTRNRSVVK